MTINKKIFQFDVVFAAENVVLHGSSSEDIDALMIGTCRPFVMDMQNPKILNLNLQ